MQKVVEDHDSDEAADKNICALNEISNDEVLYDQSCWNLMENVLHVPIAAESLLLFYKTLNNRKTPITSVVACLRTKKQILIQQVL